MPKEYEDCICPYCKKDITNRVIGRVHRGTRKLWGYKCPELDCGQTFYGDLRPTLTMLAEAWGQRVR